MKNNYDPKMATALLKKENEIEKNALTLYDEIRKVVKKFDGKTANKHLDNALKVIDKRLSFIVQYNSFRFIFTEYDDRYLSIDGRGAYVRDNSVNIAWLCVSSAYGDQAVTDDNKIIAEAILKQLEKTEDEIKKHILIVEAQLLEIDAILKRYDDIKQAIRSFNDEVNYSIREYLDLKIDNIY